MKEAGLNCCALVGYLRVQVCNEVCTVCCNVSARMCYNVLQVTSGSHRVPASPVAAAAP
jgi:hypothetical protein